MQSFVRKQPVGIEMRADTELCVQHCTARSSKLRKVQSCDTHRCPELSLPSSRGKHSTGGDGCGCGGGSGAHSHLCSLLTSVSAVGKLRFMLSDQKYQTRCYTARRRGGKLNVVETAR